MITKRDMMRKFAFLAAVTLLCLPLSAQRVKKYDEVVSDASDARITWVGRTKTDGGTVSFDWSGVYARIAFEGDLLRVKASDSKKDYFNLWIDKEMDAEPDRIVTLTGQDTTIVLFQGGNPKEKHTAILQKRTEGEQGTACFIRFETRRPLLQAEGIRERVIEFIGDSYTCGFGSENSVKTDPFKPETENANKSYAPIVSRYFGADCIWISHSGMGIARNYNDNVKDYYMPERYLQTFDMRREADWKPENGPKPSLSVIYLCTNDFSRNRQPSMGMFRRNYIQLIKEIKGFYGEDHPVLCVAGKNDPEMIAYIQAAAENCGFPNVHWMALGARVHNHESDLGAANHPNYIGHQKKAHTLIPYISTIMDWPLTGAPIR